MSSLTAKEIYDLNNSMVAAQNVALGTKLDALLTSYGSSGVKLVSGSFVPSGPVTPVDAVLWGWPGGPLVPPGSYQARLSLGDWSDTVSFEVVADPRLEVPQEAVEAQFALARDIWRELTRTHDAIRRVRDLRAQIEAVAARREDETATVPPPWRSSRAAGAVPGLRRWPLPAPAPRRCRPPGWSHPHAASPRRG